jgi:hypothetical protein
MSPWPTTTTDHMLPPLAISITLSGTPFFQLYLCSAPHNCSKTFHSYLHCIRCYVWVPHQYIMNHGKIVGRKIGCRFSLSEDQKKHAMCSSQCKVFSNFHVLDISQFSLPSATHLVPKFLHLRRLEKVVQLTLNFQGLIKTSLPI